MRVDGAEWRIGIVDDVADEADRRVLVELDHDDVITPTCLAEVSDAFRAHPQATLVYSDFTQVHGDLSPSDHRFDPAMGWRYSEEQLGARTYLRCHALEPSPHNVGYIWYAPNHVRAFRKRAYEAVGGYNRQLTVLDDHDLMIRLFLEGDFVHLDRCLYLQRIHRANTQSRRQTNAFIQQQTVRNYLDNIEALATAWAGRRSLAALHLRTHGAPAAPDDPSVRHAVIDPTRPRVDMPDSSVGVLWATDVLQRVADRAELFNECYRVLAHGGLMVTRTPSTDGRGAFQDPRAIAFYNENSFWYLTQERLRASIPTLRARLQMSHVGTSFPTPWEEAHNIAYVHANLLAIKGGPRQGGPLLV